jgi:transposase-like protein
MQGRPKGGRNKYYTKEEKLKIVELMIEKNISCLKIEKEYNISHSLSNKWLREYLNKGEKGLENKIKPGNPLVKYMNKKNMTREEELEYENMKLRIENERLKKGYIVKGDGQIVVFNMQNKKNSK